MLPLLAKLLKNILKLQNIDNIKQLNIKPEITYNITTKQINIKFPKIDIVITIDDELLFNEIVLLLRELGF